MEHVLILAPHSYVHVRLVILVVSVRRVRVLQTHVSMEDLVISSDQTINVRVRLAFPVRTVRQHHVQALHVKMEEFAQSTVLDIFVSALRVIQAPAVK